ncbi:hypothetical protein RGF97_32735 [Streptomyces roseicoloratus]|uniref:Serine/threonine protein kinase n=1 Tax=Streptomyces roseicoloratus TaxID=2508722 RepID=A0ABY9S2F6_9ACTN|nr:hypothetical protein [Streptomyces roseicoloratus]WMX48612.1 hypothetical protein RGF97_32735 [Streptomyces roseicoloratus]
MGLAAALVFGVGGAATVYVLTKDDDKKASASDNGKPGTQTGSGGVTGASSSPSSDGSGESGSAPSAKPSAKADPKPVTYENINLTRGYHLTFGDEVVRPQDGEDDGYDLSYDSGSYLEAESTGGTMVLLDPGQEGTLEVCRAETRFTQKVNVDKLAPGRQMCVTTGTGHMGLVTVKAFSPEGSPSTYMTLDLTVWRNGAV